METDQPSSEQSGEQQQDANNAPVEKTKAEGGEAQSETVVELATPDFSGMTDIAVEVTAVLGTTEMSIEQFLKIGRGAIIELNQPKDAKLDVLINDYLFAKADIRVNGEKVAIQIDNLIDHSKDLPS